MGYNGWVGVEFYKQGGVLITRKYISAYKFSSCEGNFDIPEGTVFIRVKLRNEWDSDTESSEGEDTESSEGEGEDVVGCGRFLKGCTDFSCSHGVTGDGAYPDTKG